MFSRISCLIDIAWVHVACQEVARIAHYHQYCACYLMPACNVLVWDSREAVLNVDKKTSKCAGKVDNLNQWVWLVANIACGAIDTFHDPLPTNLCPSRPQPVRQSLKKEHLYLREYARAMRVDTDEEVEEGDSHQAYCEQFQHFIYCKIGINILSFN